MAENLASNFAGLSKHQLYDIMSQMKTLIDQNQQQARQILVDNPPLTKALFQAQIMLGMVQSSQMRPNIQQPLPQQPKKLAQTAQQVNVQSHLFSGQNHLPDRKQQTNQSVLPIPSTFVPQETLQSHTKGHLNTQGASISLQQSSQLYNLPPPPFHSAPQPPSLLQPQVPIISNQSQQSLHSSGVQHLPPLPPLPQQPRPPLMQPFQHQLHSPMGPHSVFQPSGPSQPHLSQLPFNSGSKPPNSVGSSFPQGQPQLLSHPPPQSHYQVGGSHLGTDFNSQPGSSLQMERPWMPGPPDNSATGGAQLPGPPPLPAHLGGPGGPSSLPPRQQQLTQEMEQLLLQQVMSLTQEQINLLPQEQRNQVLQLQQLLLR